MASQARLTYLDLRSGPSFLIYYIINVYDHQTIASLKMCLIKAFLGLQFLHDLSFRKLMNNTTLTKTHLDLKF